VVRQAQFRRLFDPPRHRDALQRRPSALLRELLDDLDPSQSELEEAHGTQHAFQADARLRTGARAERLHAPTPLLASRR
jgi:hypothetical protein